MKSIVFCVDSQKYLYDPVHHTISTFNRINENNRMPDTSEHFKFIRKYSKSEIEYLCNHCIRQLTLSVTHSCNMRCDYCAYYYRNKNNSEQAQMDWSIAKSAIDMYFAHSKAFLHKQIGFYGGEPLLQFDLIQKCFNYIHENYHEYFTHYHMTTNGMLLKNKEIQHFLVTNAFDLYVSLDGPKSIHDRYRKDASGKPTYENLICCLRQIRENYPEYYHNHIHFNAVITPPYDYDALLDFALNLGEKVSMEPVYVTPYFQSIIDALPETNLNNDPYHFIRNERFNLDSSYRDALLQRKQYLNLINRGNPSMNIISAACVAGVSKLYVQPNGSILICEKVDELNKDYQIGSIEKGLNVERIDKTYDDFISLRNSVCAYCWAARLCKTCYVHSLNNSMNEKRCSFDKASIYNDLRYYVKSHKI